MEIKKSFILKDQYGAALVIALVMMILLTLIGLASIFSSTFEIKLSGNKRCSTDAFYAADSGVQVVIVDGTNFNTSHPIYQPFEDDTNPIVNPTTATLDVTITYSAAQRGAPRGYGISATQFEFQHYLIESTGQTCPNPVPSASTIDEKVVKLIPTLQGGS
jgi:hypothetical protein